MVRKWIFQLHQIAGLITGAVVFVVAITGCCWAFKSEIESLYDGYKKVEPQSGAILTPTAVKEIATAIFPENSIHGAVFKNPDDAIEVIFYDAKPEFYKSIFLNPYSGEVICIKDHLSGFFAFVLKGHMRLWLPKNVGEQLVGISILIFITIIISGFILWVPKKRKNLKQRTTFDWKETTRWKRKNFDLHTVIGFYISFFALVIAFTGSVISYQWLKLGFYKSLGGEKDVAFIIPGNINKYAINQESKPIDLLIQKLQKEVPEAEALELHYPKNPEESIYVEVTNSKGLYYDADYRFFDQSTLQEIETTSIYGKYKAAKPVDKILRMNFDIHIGAIGGIVGKIIAFLVSMITATLPVTGFLLWYGRKYKTYFPATNKPTPIID